MYFSYFPLPYLQENSPKIVWNFFVKCYWWSFFLCSFPNKEGKIGARISLDCDCED